MSTITVYLATPETAFVRFTGATRVRGAYQYERPVSALNIHDVLEDAFAMFNQDHDTIPHTGPAETCDDDPMGCVEAGCRRFTATAYRGSGLRSLSVGDVVVIGGTAGGPLPTGAGPGEQAYAVASLGFDPVHVLPEQIVS